MKKGTAYLAAVIFALLNFRSDAAVFYVNVDNPTPVIPYDTWDKAATTIQDAVIAGGSSGGTILVTNGVYQTGGEMNGGSNRVNILYPNFTVQSVNGPAVTVIKGFQVPGLIKGPEAVRGVFLCGGSILSGFTVTGGATVDINSSGGGICCPSATAMITNCIVTGNVSAALGGGIYQGTANNCIISQNSAASIGGGTYKGTNYNCRIIGNHARQGGGTAESTNYNCIIADNTASMSGGGGYYAAFFNCVLTGNIAITTNITGFKGEGAGAYFPLLVHSTVTGNMTTGVGGGVYGGWEYNSIIYANTAEGGGSNWMSNPRMTNCCTTPMPANLDGNITNDPAFLDFEGGVFSLRCGSPCIDSGLSNNAVMAMTTDIRGISRPLDGSGGDNARYDMGAYEFNPATDLVPAIRPGVNASTYATTYAVPLIAELGGCPDYFWWDFDDGATVTNQSRVSHLWTSSGTFNVRLWAYYSSLGHALSSPAFTVQAVPQPVYYVDVNNTTAQAPYTNWATAANLIQQAIAAGTTAGRMVLVTNGVYTNGGMPVNGALANSVALTNGVILQSVNGAALTLIQGSSGRCVYLGGYSLLNGFTFTGGHTLNIGFTNIDRSGGGAWCEPGTVVSNCVISANQSVAYGGGAYQGTFFNCTFSNNAVTNSNFHGAGGGASSATLKSCVLINNTSDSYGGGSAFSTLLNCTISGNSALFGGGAISSTLLNCIISKNSIGGGADSSSLTGCTVVRNTSPFVAGVRNCNLTNCIVYFNMMPNTTTNNWLGSTFFYSCTTPLPSGPGNSAADPLFVDAVNGNFHLQAGSRCINAGTNIFTGGDTDLGGNQRIQGGSVDAGAYEFASQVTGTFNDWLQQYGLPTDGSANYADSDGTGMNNVQKWIAGLSPTNPASVLTMLPAGTINHTNGVTVNWYSVANRTYFLQRSSNLLGQPSFYLIQSNLPGQIGTTSYIDTTATNAGPYFYRVGVQ